MYFMRVCAYMWGMHVYVLCVTRFMLTPCVFAVLCACVCFPSSSPSFGFVEFATEEGTRNAVSLNGVRLYDQAAKIDYQRPRSSPGRGRGGSGGYSGDSSYRHVYSAGAGAPPGAAGAYMPSGYPPHFYPSHYPMAPYYPQGTVCFCEVPAFPCAWFALLKPS
jgi:hypothetical protein